MRKSYRVYVNLEALEIIPKSGKRRDYIVGFIKPLGEIAYLGGDFEVTDKETSRTFQVTNVAGFSITWWIDGPVNEVKIVDIRELVQ